MQGELHLWGHFINSDLTVSFVCFMDVCVLMCPCVVTLSLVCMEAVLWLSLFLYWLSRSRCSGRQKTPDAHFKAAPRAKRSALSTSGHTSATDTMSDDDMITNDNDMINFKLEQPLYAKWVMYNTTYYPRTMQSRNPSKCIAIHTLTRWLGGTTIHMY